MDPFFTTLIIVVIAFPVLAIVAFVMALGNRERLKRLEFRLAGIEAKLAGLAGEAPAPAPAPPAPAPWEPLPAEEPEAKAEEKAPPPPEPETPVPPPAAPIPSRPKASLEERFGTQWVVWAGGIALALGGFFLVRQAIEQGWFGPGARVLLGAIVALVLIGAGEWTRRREIKTGLAGLPKAHIPSVLTAAGTAIAYADVYAAYALYHFIGPGTAFILLGVVALGTLAVALLHGPALAGLGLIGAFVTPLIVSTETPNYLALYLYLAVVTAAAFALARARLWRWLAIAAMVASVLWTLPGIGELDSLPEHVFHVAVGFVLSALLIVSGFLFGPPAARGEIDLVSSGALGAYLFAATLLVLATGHDSLALLLFCVLVVGTLAIAWRTDAAALAVPIAAIFVAAIFWHWSIDFDVAMLGLPNGPVPDSLWKPEHYLFGTPLTLGASFGALFLVSGFLAQGPEERRRISVLWAASAVFAPIAILIALYYRIAGFDRSIPFAGAAVLLAGAFALATEILTKREREGGSGTASGIFATGAIASLALALSLALEKGWLDRCPCSDGAGHCLGGREAAAPRIPLARRGGDARRARAHRLGSANRRRRGRRAADLQLAALWLRHPRRILLARRPSPQAPRRRFACAHRRCGSHPLHRAPRRGRGAPFRRARRSEHRRQRYRRDRHGRLASTRRSDRTRAHQREERQHRPLGGRAPPCRGAVRSSSWLDWVPPSIPGSRESRSADRSSISFCSPTAFPPCSVACSLM